MEIQKVLRLPPPPLFFFVVKIIKKYGTVTRLRASPRCLWYIPGEEENQGKFSVNVPYDYYHSYREKKEQRIRSSSVKRPNNRALSGTFLTSPDTISEYFVSKSY